MWRVPREAWGEYEHKGAVMPLDLDAELRRWGFAGGGSGLTSAARRRGSKRPTPLAAAIPTRIRPAPASSVGVRRSSSRTAAMTAEATGVSSSAAAVRPASTRRTLAISRRLAVELDAEGDREQGDDRGGIGIGGDRRASPSGQPRSRGS